MPEARGKNWSVDELHVLTAIYFVGDFSIGDDGRQECRVIADALGRPPASVDRQWRNIAALMRGDTELHIGKRVREILEFHLADPASGKAAAREVAKRNGWDLAHLIDRGTIGGGAITEVSASTRHEARAWMADCADLLEYKIFPSGSHGFFLAVEGLAASKRRLKMQVSCVLAGSSDQNPVRDARPSDLTAFLKARSRQIRVTALPSGRISIVDKSRADIGSERFAVTVQVIELKGNGDLRD
jgi:hypothetical protein